MGLTNTRDRFGWVAVTLHWVIALAILTNIYIGYTMVTNEDYNAYQTHKSIGLTVLALSLLRLVWRFVDPPPPFPAGMPRWERLAARVSHWLFYALMIGIPLGGWAYISASPTSDFVTTKFWGWFEVPLLPILHGLAARGAVANRIGDMHALFAYSTLALLALHVGAALKHHFWDRDAVLHHIVPVVAKPENHA